MPDSIGETVGIAAQHTGTIHAVCLQLQTAMEVRTVINHKLVDM